MIFHSYVKLPEGIYPSIHPSIHPSIYLSIYLIYLYRETIVWNTTLPRPSPISSFNLNPCHHQGPHRTAAIRQARTEEVFICTGQRLMECPSGKSEEKKSRSHPKNPNTSRNQHRPCQIGASSHANEAVDVKPFCSTLDLWRTEPLLCWQTEAEKVGVPIWDYSIFPIKAVCRNQAITVNQQPIIIYELYLPIFNLISFLQVHRP